MIAAPSCGDEAPRTMVVQQNSMCATDYMYMVRRHNNIYGIRNMYMVIQHGDATSWRYNVVNHRARLEYQ